MPVKPPPLALLRSSLLFTSRSSNVSINAINRRSDWTRSFSCIFRLKYPKSTPLHPGLVTVRGFSVRPRSESVSNRPPRSLVEDEAELSDWVSELRTSSYRAGVLTDGEDEPDRRMKKRDTDASSGSSGFRESGGLARGRGRGRGGNLGRGSDDFGVRTSRASRSLGSESDDSDDGDWRKKRSVVQGGDRGGRFESRGEGGGRFESRGEGGGRFGGRGGRIAGRGGVRGGRIEGRGGGRGGTIEGRGDGRGGRIEGRGGGRGGSLGRGSDDFGVRTSRASRSLGSESDDSDDGDWRKKRSVVQGGDRGGRFESRGEGGGRFESKGDRGGRGGRIEGRGGVRGGRIEGRGGGRGGTIEGRGDGRGGRIEGRGGGRGGRIGGRGDGSRGRPTLLESDDEIGGNFLSREKKSASSFADLIGDEDSEEEEDSDSGSDEIEMESRSSLFPNKDKAESFSPSSSSASGSYLSETRFDQCPISPLSMKAIKDAGYDKMTIVQEATLPVILKGKDVMAKARTGTGKTVAFLLPSIEAVVNSPPANRDERRQPILVLVICPTRELASQAAVEANNLLKYHTSIGVQVVIGGTRLTVEQKRMQANPCQILVATPGRLKDHIENTPGFATRIMGLKVLVLDEADHLLDMGFRRDIERIIAAVPKQRQTLLFSATIPDEVRQVSNIALKRDHEYINTVEAGSEATHSQVRQMHLVAPLEKHFPLLYAILKEHISEDVNYKVLVFCTTAMVTKLVADMLGELNLNVREIHSRKPQSYRTRVSDEFRKSTGLILVTSDVSARGVDYPDVTLVMQLGLPADKAQYIHRLGRTGRKGKEGQGILVLAPWEESFLSSIKDLPITKAPVPTVDPDIHRKVEKALSNVEMKSKESAYQAWLGYYNSNKIVGRDKFRLVELANEFSRCMGLDTPPAIPKLVLGKMGLKNVPGLRSK